MKDTADRLVKVSLIPQLKHLARLPDLLVDKRMAQMPLYMRLECQLDKQAVDDILNSPCAQMKPL